MKLDLLITELNVGGAEKALTELAIGMQGRGHQVRVISIASAPSSPQDGLISRLSSHQIPTLFGGFDSSRSLINAIRWLNAVVQQDVPDVLQSFLFHANCLAATTIKRGTKHKVVGGLRVAERRSIRLMMEKFALAKMQHVVCVSESVQSFATSRLSVNPHHCSVIPNGVSQDHTQNTTPYRLDNLGWNPDTPVVLFVGRLHPQKGIELLQRRYSQSTVPQTDENLLLIGDGPLHEPLARWASETIDHRVHLLPWQADVAPFYKAASLLVLPSHYEGMPNVVLEAMAAGLPVVCSRVEGSHELLGPPESQRSRLQGFPPGDATAMGQLIEAFVNDPALRQEIGTANRDYILQNFSIQKMVQHYDSLYDRLLSN